MNLRVVDDAKRELAMGRDLAALAPAAGRSREPHARASRSRAWSARASPRWDFGDLPAEVTFRRGNQTLTGYPGARGRGRERRHPPLRHARQGGRGAPRRREAPPRLRAQGAGEAARARAFRASTPLALRLQSAMPADKLREDLVGGRPRPRVHRRGRAAAHAEGLRGAEEARQGAAARGDGGGHRATPAPSPRRTRPRGPRSPPARPSGASSHEVKAQRDRLVYPGLPRPHAVGEARAPAALSQGPRAAPRASTAAIPSATSGTRRWWRACGRNTRRALEADREAGRRDPDLEEFRWLVEELRVSLFAQELKTPFPVSAKRLQKFWDERLRR